MCASTLKTGQAGRTADAQRNKRHLTAEGHAGMSLHDSLKSTLSPASPTQSRWPVWRPPLPFRGRVEALSCSFFAPIMYHNRELHWAPMKNGVYSGPSPENTQNTTTLLSQQEPAGRQCVSSQGAVSLLALIKYSWAHLVNISQIHIYKCTRMHWSSISFYLP